MLHDALLAWYARERRDLPWRRTSDPYAILVSEVMLQQTQVARVAPRFEEWLERWPGEASLAGARRPEVLAAWVGLGYNTRAVRLQEACRIVVRDGWPRTARGLQALPGVGPYTAAAVASFAFGEQVAAVDTNVRRVAARLGCGSPQELLPAGRAHDWNQAMMELGATTCGAGPLAAAPVRSRTCAPRADASSSRRGRRTGHANASRTPRAGCAGGSWPRWPGATSCPARSRRSASVPRSTRSCATGWSWWSTAPPGSRRLRRR